MSQGFEFFLGTKTENQAPRITLRKGGQLVLTEAAVRMLGQGVTHVQIGFNEKTQAVGLRPASEETEGRYRLRSQPTSTSRLVNGKRFFAHRGRALEKARTFDAEEFGDTIVGFHLTEMSPSAATPAIEATEASRDETKKSTSRRSKAGKAS